MSTRRETHPSSPATRVSRRDFIKLAAGIGGMAVIGETAVRLNTANCNPQPLRKNLEQWTGNTTLEDGKDSLTVFDPDVEMPIRQGALLIPQAPFLWYINQNQDRQILIGSSTPELIDDIAIRLSANGTTESSQFTDRRIVNGIQCWEIPIFPSPDRYDPPRLFYTKTKRQTGQELPGNVRSVVVTNDDSFSDLQNGRRVFSQPSIPQDVLKNAHDTLLPFDQVGMKIRLYLRSEGKEGTLEFRNKAARERGLVMKIENFSAEKQEDYIAKMYFKAVDTWLDTITAPPVPNQSVTEAVNNLQFAYNAFVKRATDDQRDKSWKERRVSDPISSHPLFRMFDPNTYTPPILLQEDNTQSQIGPTDSYNRFGSCILLLLRQRPDELYQQLNELNITYYKEYGQSSFTMPSWISNYAPGHSVIDAAIKILSAYDTDNSTLKGILPNYDTLQEKKFFTPVSTPLPTPTPLPTRTPRPTNTPTPIQSGPTPVPSYILTGMP